MAGYLVCKYSFILLLKDKIRFILSRQVSNSAT